jgi:hypothetical protein
MFLYDTVSSTCYFDVDSFKYGIIFAFVCAKKCEFGPLFMPLLIFFNVALLFYYRCLIFVLGIHLFGTGFVVVCILLYSFQCS